MSTKKSNPLYHVSNDGKDVESVDGVLELIIKKLGLTPALSVLEDIFSFLLEQVSSYAMFSVVKEIIDELVEKLLAVYSKIRPLLSI
ncbi:hypothetical protein [Halobacteriovorax sp. HLS]|uniref:hypothetical protein n=1 Tax=Halobacteriovorax sp. HLS TaxID=2234000 RepID=UPI000FDAD4AA|nr:hypothetical protein [Halobacteriovorax sp. HLS]